MRINNEWPTSSQSAGRGLGVPSSVSTQYDPRNTGKGPPLLDSLKAGRSPGDRGLRWRAEERAA
jgi:hypothetical protein